MFLCVLMLLLLPGMVHALVTGSGDRVHFDTPVDDDVFAIGGQLSVNAPVRSLVVAGGEVLVNAPVEGDVVAAGGTVTINAPVGGKVVLAGGMVTLNSTIGRNALMYGGDVKMTSNTVIGADALVSASRVANHGEVRGNLTVSSQQFTDTGKAGHLSFTRERSTLGSEILGFLSLATVLFSIGMGILGLLMIHFTPGPFRLVEEQVRARPLVKILAGLGGILGGIILTILLALTVIGIPIALCVCLGLIAGMLFATLFVSSSLGRFLADRFGRTLKDWQYFLLGFVVLQLSFRIPFLGMVILAIALCLGFGALMYALPSCRTLFTGGSARV